MILAARDDAAMNRAEGGLYHSFLHESLRDSVRMQAAPSPGTAVIV